MSPHTSDVWWLEILADAVGYAEGRSAGELHALLDEWPAAAERSARRWSEALQDARQVVQAIPADVRSLVDNFVAGWPHEPGPVDDDLFRITPEDALARAGEVAVALTAIDLVAGCTCLLSLATLGSEDPLGPGRSLGPERNLETLLTHGWPEWSGTMTRRGRELLGAVTEWLAMREDSPEARRVAAFAAGQLVAVSFEFSREASSSAREIRLGAFLAPNDGRSPRPRFRGPPPSWPGSPPLLTSAATDSFFNALRRCELSAEAPTPASVWPRPSGRGRSWGKQRT